MGSSYPSGLDNFAEASPSNLGDSDTSGRTHSERHDDVEAAVEQIEETLGTLPQGSDATVRDRIAGAEDDAATALSAVNTHTHGSTPPALPLTGGALSGPLELPDGSAAAPALTNTGDTNTGLLFPAADTVAVSTGGTEKVRIDSSGFVGIGTGSPQNLAHIYGTLRVTGAAPVNNSFQLFNNSSGAVDYGGTAAHYNGGTNDAAIYIGGAAFDAGSVRVATNPGGGITERMRIDSAGLITGTGTSLGAWTAYTPTLAQGASTNIAKTYRYGLGDSCRYALLGKMVFAVYNIVATAAGTAGSAVTLTLPTAAIGGLLGAIIGSGYYYDTSTSFAYKAVINCETTTTVTLMRSDTTTTSMVGADPNIAVDSGDVITFTIVYEAA